MFIFNIILVGFFLNILLTTEQGNAENECYVLPDITHCPADQVLFYLYTRKIKDNPHIMNVNDTKTIDSAPFVAGKQIIVLIHGYTGHKDYSPNTEIRPAYLENGDYNIISVDYNPLAREPCYSQAVSNLPAVSICIADILEKIIKQKQFKWSDIHIIGFSLGAQVSGLIANYVKTGKIERITGLDPAKPFFMLAGNDKKLDKSDAKFVDVIHTDIKTRGMFRSMGHIDFYVNGGKSQPGCAMEESESSCNHGRAPLYYAESINSKVGFYGFKCASFNTWLISQCRADNSYGFMIMGKNTPANATGVYFVTTNNEAPYAQGSIATV